MDITEIQTEQYQYIWYSLFNYLAKNKVLKNIRYEVSNNISPYMEINTDFINRDALFENKELVLEINPFSRFSHVFSDILHPDLTAYPELRAEIVNIMAHMLGNIDLQEGLNKRIMMNRIIAKSIEQEKYGSEVATYFRDLSRKEKIIIADGIQDKYHYAKEMMVFQKVFSQIFKDSIIYNSIENEERVVLYINEKKTKANKQKEKLIEKLFLPLGLKTKVFWEYHFGVIGNPETLIIGNFVAY